MRELVFELMVVMRQMFRRIFTGKSKKQYCQKRDLRPILTLCSLVSLIFTTCHNSLPTELLSLKTPEPQEYNNDEKE